jgi:hypothetical protein
MTCFEDIECYVTRLWILIHTVMSRFGRVSTALRMLYVLACPCVHMVSSSKPRMFR